MDLLPGDVKEPSMFAMTKTRDTAAMRGVVVVRFECASGRVRGTNMHGSMGSTDEAGAKRGGEEFVGKLAKQLGGAVELDTIQVPLEELQGTWVERVDTATRKVVKVSPRSA
jgi:hypothetical protein